MEHKHFLVGVNSIMRKALIGKEKYHFRRSPTLTPFTDGFRVDSRFFNDGFSLQSFLKDFDMDVMMPQAPNQASSRFVQLASGPYDLTVNHSALQKAA